MVAATFVHASSADAVKMVRRSRAPPWRCPPRPRLEI